MPLQNRVTPLSQIESSPFRGLFMGNRGCLHNDRRQLVRQVCSVRRWICCRLEFKGRRRELMAPGQYTELFFLDEATALAAGHRPCCECRREDYKAFVVAWGRALGALPGADDMDRRLHAERKAMRSGQAVHRARAAALPEGAMVQRAGHEGVWLIAGGYLHRWSHAGYSDHVLLAPDETVRLATAPTLVEVLRHGYCPQFHPSAQPGAPLL